MQAVDLLVAFYDVLVGSFTFGEMALNLLLPLLWIPLFVPFYPRKRRDGLTGALAAC